jgi:hypothetical protein
MAALKYRSAAAAAYDTVQSHEQPTHVCLKQPCAFCDLQAGRALPKEHLVRFMSQTKRVMIDNLLDLLPSLDEHQLDAVSYVIKNMVASAPKPQPHVPERRRRPRLAWSANDARPVHE